MLPESIKKFIDSFAKLPGIGPRQATRLAFYIKSLGDAAVGDLSQSILQLKNLKTCAECFFMHENKLCPICANPQRDKRVIAIVEKETELISLERTKKFTGVYLVLGELTKNGILNTLQKLRLNSLKARLHQEQAEEIILAINPTTYGDISAGVIAQELKGCAKKISRLGRGIPTGGEIEFADEDTLGSALDNRG